MTNSLCMDCCSRQTRKGVTRTQKSLWYVLLGCIVNFRCCKISLNLLNWIWAGFLYKCTDFIACFTKIRESLPWNSVKSQNASVGSCITYHTVTLTDSHHACAIFLYLECQYNLGGAGNIIQYLQSYQMKDINILKSYILLLNYEEKLRGYGSPGWHVSHKDTRAESSACYSQFICVGACRLKVYSALYPIRSKLLPLKQVCSLARNTIDTIFLIDSKQGQQYLRAVNDFFCYILSSSSKKIVWSWIDFMDVFGEHIISNFEISFCLPCLGNWHILLALVKLADTACALPLHSIQILVRFRKIYKVCFEIVKIPPSKCQ